MNAVGTGTPRDLRIIIDDERHTVSPTKGLHLDGFLEKGGFRYAVMDAVVKATEKGGKM